MIQSSEQTPSGVIRAVCPECRLELTESKRVEKLKTRTEKGQPGSVFYCPECGRFFTAAEPDSAHHS